MGSGDWIVLIIIGLLCVVGAVYDARTKTVPVWLLVVGSGSVFAAGILPFLCGEKSWYPACGVTLPQRIIGLLPGAVLLALSLRKQMLGIADAVLILLVGWGIGFRLLCFFLTMSFLCLFPAALFCMAVLHRRRTDTLPFYPFAALGWLALTVCLLV